MSRSQLEKWPIFSVLDEKFTAKIRMVMVYGNLASEALMVLEDGSVYAIGTNAVGCLGTGDSFSLISNPKKVPVLSDKGVKDFVCGSGPHVLALTDEGKIYSWGHNGFGELGHCTLHPMSTPTRIEKFLTDKVIVQAACGSHHSLALTADGDVFAWGQNSSGQVAIAERDISNVPLQVTGSLKGQRVIHIACGQATSTAVTSRGEVYRWGGNGRAQRRDCSYQTECGPQIVSALLKIVIVKVACGYSHTLAMSDEGYVYVWGENSFGQLGIGTKKNCTDPVKITSTTLGKVVDIAAVHNNHISAARTRDERIFMWGQCRGHSILNPTLTPFVNLHEVFAAYAQPAVMHSPLILLYDDEKTNVVDSLRQAFDDPTTSDLTIKVEGKPIHVHKTVLKLRSEYFQSMFRKNWTESSSSTIEHEDFRYDVYRSFLKYLYTGEVEAQEQNLIELLALANAYFEPQLKNRCVQLLRGVIGVENVLELYDVAVTNESPELEDICFKFALNHMTLVVQSAAFSKLSLERIKTFISKAALKGAFKS